MSTTNITDWGVSAINASGQYTGGVTTSDGNIETGDGNITTVNGYVASGTYISSVGQRFGSQNIIDSTPVNPNASYVILDGSFVTVGPTLSGPTENQILNIICKDATNPVTVTLTSGTWDGTNTVATFGTGDSLQAIGDTSRFLILMNNGVVFS